MESGNNPGSMGQTVNGVKRLNVAVSQRQGRFSPREGEGKIKDSGAGRQSRNKSLT